MKQALVNKLSLSIYELAIKIKDERDKQKDLIYESSVTSTLEEVCRDEDEKSHWAMEKTVIDSMIQLSEHQSDQLIDDLKTEAEKLKAVS